EDAGTLAVIYNAATVSANGDTGQPGETASAAITIQSAAVPAPIQNGDFGTNAWWNSTNGLNLINQLNGGSTATALGNWLAAEFPHLYGSAVDPSNPYEKNLAGLTNAQVASFYQTLFNAPPANAFYSQMLATALAVYATDASLAGGTYAAAYGFDVTTWG